MVAQACRQHFIDYCQYCKEIIAQCACFEGAPKIDRKRGLMCSSCFAQVPAQVIQEPAADVGACDIVKNGGPYQVTADCIHISTEEWGRMQARLPVVQNQCVCGNAARYIDETGVLCCGICPLKTARDSVRLADVPALLAWVRQHQAVRIDDPMFALLDTIIPPRRKP